MNVIMNLAITNPGGGIEFVRKTIDLPFAPYIGMVIDYGIDSPKNVTNVSLTLIPDYENPYLYLEMNKSETHNEDEQKRLVEAYKEDGWTVPGEG